MLMFRRSIPTRFAFKFFYVGLVTIILVAVLMADILSRESIPMLVSYEGIIADLALVFLLIYFSLEYVNYRDARRFVNNRYYYDHIGIYREHALIMDWNDVSDVKVTLETFMDKIPAHRETAWEPYFNMVKDYSTPELVARKRVARIIIKPLHGEVRHKLVIQSTSFTPLLRETYRKMRQFCLDRNGSAKFELQLLPQADESSRSEAKVQ